MRYYAGWDLGLLGSDGISHADPATIAAARERPAYACTRCGAEARTCHHSHGFTIDQAALSDAIAESVADTLRPVEHLTRDCVVMAGDLHLYRLDADGGIAMGTERSKAAHFSRAEAISAVSLLGEGYRVER